MPRFLKVTGFVLVLCVINGFCWNVVSSVLGIPLVPHLLICGVTGGVIGWNSEELYDSVFKK